MRHIKKMLAATSFVISSTSVLGLGPASAEDVLMHREMSLDLATSMAQAAVAKCHENGFSVAVAVVDRAGQVRVFLRGDDTPPHTAELARRKAYTARTFKRTSAEWAKRTAEPAELAPQRQLADVIALGGGVPISIGNDTVGAIGVSGSPGQDKDEACARAGIDSVASRLH